MFNGVDIWWLRTPWCPQSHMIFTDHNILIPGQSNSCFALSNTYFTLCNGRLLLSYTIDVQGLQVQCRQLAIQQKVLDWELDESIQALFCCLWTLFVCSTYPNTGGEISPTLTPSPPTSAITCPASCQTVTSLSRSFWARCQHAGKSH